MDLDTPESKPQTILAALNALKQSLPSLDDPSSSIHAFSKHASADQAFFLQIQSTLSELDASLAASGPPANLSRTVANLRDYAKASSSFFSLQTSVEEASHLAEQQLTYHAFDPEASLLKILQLTARRNQLDCLSEPGSKVITLSR